MLRSSIKTTYRRLTAVLALSSGSTEPRKWVIGSSSDAVSYYFVDYFLLLRTDPSVQPRELPGSSRIP